MPDFDSGAYFFAALIPVRTQPCRTDEGEVTTPVNALRAALAVLPTARQSPAEPTATCVSPFARDPRTHFARFAILDDVTFNGRVGKDALWAGITQDSRAPETADRLGCPYLIFAAEFDAESGAEAELDRWLSELWRVMEPELSSLFRWCWAFERVADARSFVRWMKWCRLETSLPFHDYWTEPPKLPELTTGQMASNFVAGAAPAGLLSYGLARLLRFRRAAGPLAIGLGMAAGLAGLYIQLRTEAARPYLAAPDADLQSVLKALYLQQRFAEFVVEAQGETPEALHARFGEFLRLHQPASPTPTQAPGVVVTPESLT